MFTHFRIILIEGGVFLYAGIFTLLLLRMKSCSRALRPWADHPYDPAMLLENAVKQRKDLRFSMLRHGIDFTVFLAFLISGLYPAFFVLYPESLAGFFRGFAFLIFITLLISIAVDWIRQRTADGGRSEAEKNGWLFFIQESSGIAVIGTEFILVSFFIRGMEELDADPAVTVFFSSLILLICRAFLLLLQYCRRFLQQLPEDSLTSSLSSLCARKDIPIQRVLVKRNAVSKATYGIYLIGLRNKKLVLDQGILRTLSESEILASVIHMMELRRQKVRPWEFFIRGMQYAAVTGAQCFLMKYICSHGGSEGILQTGAGDLFPLLLPVAGAFLVFLLLQLLRNLGLKKMMLQADMAAVHEGYGDALQKALIKTADLEMLNPEPLYEYLMNRPVFLPDRIRLLEQMLRDEEGG